MTYESYSHGKRAARKGSGARVVLFLLLLVVIVVLGAFGFMQVQQLNLLQSEMDDLKHRMAELEDENVRLERRYQEISEENRELVEENSMLRSEVVIYNGNRETNLVAITIDDGGPAELIEETLEHFRREGVRGTFFPMGSWVELHPEVWKRAVEEGHELGNHTYSHPFLSRLSDDRVKEELFGWQEAVDQAMGYSYRALFFRPPYMDGFTSPGSATANRLQNIVADKGMFPILWDVETVYALRNQPYTTENVVNHVLNSARGGSVVLLHFTEVDIAALPQILSGLKARGLEPTTLSELLLASSEKSTEAQ